MPRKKGADAASPASAKKRQTPRVAASRRQNARGAPQKQQAEEEATAAASATAAAGLVASAATEEKGSGSAARGGDAAVVVKSEAVEGFGVVAASRRAEQGVQTAEVEQEEEAASRAGDAATEMAVDVTVSKGDFGGSANEGEMNGSVAREDAGAVAVKAEINEELDAAATVGLPAQTRGAYAAAEVDKAGEATVTFMVGVGDGAAETNHMVEDAAATGDVAGSQEEEKVPGLVAKQVTAAVEARMDVEVESEELSSPIVDTDAVPVAPAAAGMPKSLPPLQMGGPALAIYHSVDELRGLSTALSIFTRRWDELSHHIDSIRGSLDALSRVLDVHPTLEGKQRQAKKMQTVADEETTGEGKVDKTKDEGAKRAEKTKKVEEAQMDLKSICEKMLGRNLRKYVVAHMSEVDRLREEVPKALQFAPNPAKLVLDCVGRFWRQGSRAYTHPNSPMVSVRRACILVLEFLLLSGRAFSGSGHLSSSPPDVTIADAAPTEAAEEKEPSIFVEEEAKVAAVAWKDRLVLEGGIASASAVDALGLTLFVGCFGIPSDLDSETMYNLFHLSNMKKKADILRRSPFIVEKLPDIIEDLVQKEKYIAAADLVCGFGVQEKHPPLDLISSFLIKANTDAKEERREGQSSVISLKEATANQLAAYKSVVKCLEDHKLDASSLASFRIKEKISELEKDIANFEKKLKDEGLKRKAEDAELTSKVKAPAKRSASTPAEATFGRPPSRVLPTEDHAQALSLSKSLYQAPATASLLAESGYSVGNSIHPSTERSGASYGWYQEGALNDGSINRNNLGVQHLGPRGLIGPPPSENLLQLPSSALGMGSRTTVSSLYEFADNVMENELYYGRSVGRDNTRSNSAAGGKGNMTDEPISVLVETRKVPQLDKISR